MTWRNRLRTKYRMRHGAVLVLALAAATACRGATPNDCQSLRKHGQRAEAQACYESLDAGTRAGSARRGILGAAECTRRPTTSSALAVADSPNNASYRVRWGRLLHERFNNTDAENLFKEALQLDPKNAPAYVGLALVSADGFDNKAVEWDAKALGIRPQAGGSARADGQSRSRRLATRQGRRAGRRGAQDFA